MAKLQLFENAEAMNQAQAAVGNEDRPWVGAESATWTVSYLAMY